MKIFKVTTENTKKQLNEKSNPRLDRDLYVRLKSYIANPNYYTPAFQTGFEKVAQKVFPFTP